MTKLPTFSPYIVFSFGIFLNFFWIYFRENLSMQAQIVCFALTVFVIVLSSFLAAIQQKGKKKLAYLQGGRWILFIYYLYILSMLLFFGGLFQINRTYQGEFQLIPFQTIDNYINFYRNTGSFVSFYNLLGNVLILMPLGYFIPTLFPCTRKFWVFIPLVAGIALAVELIQWKTGTGIGDIDDSILNFLGAVLAYSATRCSQMIQEALQT